MNKKLIYVLICLIGIVHSSCEKESINETTVTTTSSIDNVKLKCVDGILNFESQEAFQKTINLLNSMNRSDVEALEKSVGFLSQHSIFNQISDEEMKYFEKIYSHLPKDISIEELDKLGLRAKHSDLYYQYLNSGLIKNTLDEKGYESMDINLFNPAYASVINMQGLVIVNDTICEYSASYLKLLTSGNRNDISLLKNAFVTAKEGLVIVFDYSEESKSTHSWSRNSGHVYDNGKRFDLVIHGYSSATQTLLHSSFWLESKGQVSQWGNWVYSNNYNPIYRIKGDWQYRYMILMGNQQITKTSIWWDGDKKSPFNSLFNGTNHVLMNLSPNGYWSNDTWFTYFDACDVWDYHFDGDFYYGSSGRHITYDK